MDKKELCRKVEKSARHIMVINEKEVVSAGTGVTIDEDGLIVTANHVIAYDEGGIIDGVILVRTDDGLRPYSPVLRGEVPIRLEMGSVKGIKGIEIDLNLLKPIRPLENRQKFIPLREGVAEVGEDVIMAGYSDEVDFEFHPDEIIDQKVWNMDHVPRLKREVTSKSFAARMLKSGMIGNVQKLFARNLDLRNQGIDDSVQLRGAYYGIDNHLTKGGSGGPVVDYQGNLVGVVTERTRAESDIPLVPLLPSGTGVAISHQLITWVLPYID